MTLWLKEDTIYSFFHGWGLDSADEIEVTQIRAPEGERGYKVRNIADKNLMETDQKGLHTFLRNVDGRYFIDTDDNGDICMYIYCVSA